MDARAFDDMMDVGDDPGFEIGPRDSIELVHGYVIGNCWMCNGPFAGELEAFWRLTMRRLGLTPMVQYIHGSCWDPSKDGHKVQTRLDGHRYG